MSENFIFPNTFKTLREFNAILPRRAPSPIPMCTASLLMGGFTRAGLEDNLYLEKGRLAKSSAKQVEKTVRIAKELGLEPAAPDEARQILGLKGMNKVKHKPILWS